MTRSLARLLPYGVPVPRHSFIVLEDHPLVLGAITDHLSTAFPGATFAYQGAQLLEALEQAESAEATCAIVDLDLGDGRAPAEIVMHLRDAGIPVVMISAHEQALLVQEAVIAGASAYVPKRSIIDQLAEAVSAAEVQQRWLTPDFAAVLVPVEGSTVALDPLAERALVLYAAGLPSSMISSRTGIAVDQVRPLLESAVQAYWSPNI
jgi:DNA-binding NarL/FixJ family response regulator